MMDSPAISLKKLQEELHTTVFNQDISFNIINNLYEKFCNYFNHCEKVVSEDIKVLANCCLKFIDCIRNHIDNTPIHGKVYIARVEEFVSVIENASQLENIRDDYLIYITVPILEKVTEPDITKWFSKELLRNFNLVVRGTRRYIRHRIVENSTLTLCKLAELVCTCGDYDYQVLLLETIFNLCSEAQIKKYASELFPTSPKFQDKFCGINRKCFDKDVRTFLNMVNSELKKVISVKCEVAQLGDIKIVAPKFPDLEELPVWTDFNLGTRTITIFCDKDPFTANLCMENSNDDEKIELITINVDDISNVFASRLLLPESSFSLGSIVLFSMTDSCSLMNSYSVEAIKARYLKLAIYKCTELKELLDELLPNWFGENFKYFHEDYSKLDQTSTKIQQIVNKREDQKALPYKPIVNSNQESSATAALHQLQASKAVSELRPKKINIGSKQKAYKPLQANDNSNESNVYQPKVSVSSFGHSCEEMHKSTVKSGMKFPNKPEYKSLPVDNSSTSIKSRSADALSSISSLSDAQPLKDRLHAHQPENCLTTEKSRKSKSPKIHKTDQLKEIAADPEQSVQKQEDSRILTSKKKNIVKVKWPWPKKVSVNKSIPRCFPNRTIDDLTLNEKALNNNCKNAGSTEGNQKSQDCEMKVQESIEQPEKQMEGARLKKVSMNKSLSTDFSISSVVTNTQENIEQPEKQIEGARPKKVLMNKSLSTDLSDLIVVTNAQESIEQREKPIEGESKENKKIKNITAEDLQTDDTLKDTVLSSISPKISRKKRKSDKLVQNEAKSLLEEVSTKKEKFLKQSYENKTDEAPCKVYDTTEEVPKEIDSEDFFVKDNKKCSDVIEQAPKKISSVNEYKLRRNSQRKCKNGVKSNGDEASEKQKQSQIKKISSQTCNISEKQTINEDYFKNCDDVEQNVIETSSQEFCDNVKSVSQRKLRLQAKRYNKIPQKCSLTRKERRSKRISKKIEDKENKAADINYQGHESRSHESHRSCNTLDVNSAIKTIQPKTKVAKTNDHHLLVQSISKENLTPAVNAAKRNALESALVILPDFQASIKISKDQNKEMISVIEKTNAIETDEDFIHNTRQKPQSLPIGTNIAVEPHYGKELKKHNVLEIITPVIAFETNRDQQLVQQNTECNKQLDKCNLQSSKIPVAEKLDSVQAREDRIQNENIPDRELEKFTTPTTTEIIPTVDNFESMKTNIGLLPISSEQFYGKTFEENVAGETVPFAIVLNTNNNQSLQEHVDLNKQLNKCEFKIPETGDIIPQKVACTQTRELQNAIVVEQLQDEQLKEHNVQSSKTISNNQNQEFSIIENTENYSKNTIDIEEQESTQNLPITTIVIKNNGKELEENVIATQIDCETNENHLLPQNLESNEKARKVSSQQETAVEEGGLLTNREKLLFENTISEPSSANSKRKISQDNHCDDTPKNKTRKLAEINLAEEVNTTATNKNVRKMKKMQRKRRENLSMKINETTSNNVIPQKEKEIIDINVGKLTVKYTEAPITITNENHAEIGNNLEKSASIVLEYQNNNHSKTSMKICSPKRQNRLKNSVFEKPSKIQNTTPKRRSLKKSKKHEEPKKHCELWDSEFDELMQSLQRTFEHNVDSKGSKKRNDNKYYNNKRKIDSSKYKKLKPLEKQGRTASKEKKNTHNSGYHYKKLRSQVIEHIVDTSVIVLSDSEDITDLQFNVQRAEKKVPRSIKIDDNTMKIKTTELLTTKRIDNEDYSVSPTNTAVQPSQISKDIGNWVKGATIIQEIRQLKRRIYNIELVVLDIQNTLKHE